MRKYEYSNELVNLVKKYLVDDDWHFSFDENTGMFDFGLRVKSKIQKINYIVDVHEDEIVVYGMCPIGADHTDCNMMAQMAEFLCRANYGLKNGCFELDFRDGEVRYRSFIDCEDVMPSTEVIKNSIHCTAAMFKRYAPGIVDIIFSGCTAKEAITKCEKSPEDELRSMIAEAVGEDMEGADIEAMLARLAANLGITDEGEDTATESEVLENVAAEPDKKLEAEEEGDDVLDNVITLQNEEGDDVSFEFLDLMEYEGDEYVVLLPVEDSEGEVVILKLDDTDEESESYTSVDDEETLAELFRIFKEKFIDEFDFVDGDD